MEVNEQKNVVIVGRSVEGGKTRSESVINGLKALDSGTDRVVIMEAARPLVTTTQVRQLVNDKADFVIICYAISKHTYWKGWNIL